MDKSKKIMAVCITVLSVICVLSLGILIGTRINKSPATSAEIPASESVSQTQTSPAVTEIVPEDTEPSYPQTEPEEIETAVPTTTTTTLPPMTKAPTTIVPTTKVTTTKAPKTTAPTTTLPVTTTPMTKAPETTAAATRSSSYALIVNSDGGASDFSGGGRYAPGEFVRVSMTPRRGYAFVRWESSNKAVLSDSTSQTYVFQMPESTVSLHAVTKTLPLLTVNKGKGILSVTSSSYYAAGEKVTVTAQVENGYEFTGWTSSSSVTGTSSAGLNSSSPTFTFTMPDRSITLTANAKAKGYALRVFAGDGVRSVSGDGRYNPGDKVTLNISMKENYTLNRWDGLNASYSGNTATFYMPAKDLTLTANGTWTEKYIVSILKGQGVSYCTGSGSYAPGATVTITCSVQDGYTFSLWKSSDIQLVASSTKSTYTFTMPRGNVTMTAYTEKADEKYMVTITPGSGIRLVEGTGKYAPGDTVTVDCSPESGYSFSSWTVYTATSVEEVKTKRYTFSMPRSNVSLTANAIEKQESDAIPSVTQ